MIKAISTSALLLIVFVMGLAAGLFLLPFWIGPFISAAKNGNPADWIGFAGNFGAGMMTLIAAIIAWFAVQLQIKAQEEMEDRKESLKEEQDQKNRIEANLVATIALTQPVHAASVMLYAVRKASAADTVADVAMWDKATDQANAQVEQTLSHFSLQEISSELATPNRLAFLMVLTQVGSIVNIYRRSPGILNRAERLKVLKANLEKLQTYLEVFDPDLAAVYKRDGVDRV